MWTGGASALGNTGKVERNSNGGGVKRSTKRSKEKRKHSVGAWEKTTDIWKGRWEG